jgi:hypothetical protein
MSNTKGTILYFAILILSVIFTISIGLSLIIFGQIKIQREIGHSVIALCAADTGIERALYEIYTTSTANPLPFSVSGNLDNGATFGADAYASSSLQCGTSTQYYCIKSRGTFKETTRAIDASF